MGVIVSFLVDKSSKFERMKFYGCIAGDHQMIMKKFKNKIHICYMNFQNGWISGLSRMKFIQKFDTLKIYNQICGNNLK